jgi:hypothetical protein
MTNPRRAKRNLAQVSQSPEPDTNKVMKIDNSSKPANKHAGPQSDGHSSLAFNELSRAADSKTEHTDVPSNMSTQVGSDAGDDDNFAETSSMLSSKVFEEVVGYVQFAFVL